MGCECCKQINPKDYQRCKIANNESYRDYIAPCGNHFGKGNNYTPPKKKKKRRK